MADPLSQALASREDGVVSYMEGMDGSLHPALDTGIQSGVEYNQQKQRWVVKQDTTLNYEEIYKDCFPARDAFLETINKYLEKKGHAPLAVSAEHNWTQVEESMKAACDAMERAAAKDIKKRKKGGDDDAGAPAGQEVLVADQIRQGYRALCAHARDARGFLDLIPSDFMCSSVLCGGLKVLFNALESTDEQLVMIAAAMEAIPRILNDKAASIRIFGGDEELHRRLASLYVAILDALRFMLSRFIKSSTRAGFRNIVSGSSATTKLQEKIDRLKLAAEDFNQRALICSQLLQDDAVQLQYHTLFLTHAAVGLQHKGRESQDRMAASIEELLARTKALNDTAAFLIESVREQKRPKVRKAIQNKPKRNHGHPGSASNPAAGGLTADLVLQRFLYEGDLIPGDCDRLAKPPSQQHQAGGHRLDEDRILALAQSIRLRTWLVLADEPAALLVNGRIAAVARPRNEISFVAARLVQSLLLLTTADAAGGDGGGGIGGGRSEFVPVAYFCGLHRRMSSDVYASPPEMMVSLLLQLVDRHRGFGSSVLQMVLDSLRPHDLESLCSLFEELVLALPASTVLFVVVDGVNFFAEPPDRADEFARVARCLVGLLRRPRGEVKATVKVLLTSATRSDFVEDLFVAERGEVMNLPRHCRPRGTYTEGKFAGLLTDGVVDMHGESGGEDIDDEED